MTRECCFGCGFKGTARAARAHHRRQHPALTIGKHVGRPPKGVCDLCGFHHDEINAPGRALRRKYLVHGGIATAVGVVPPHERRQMSVLNLPHGVKRITKVELAVERCRGPFRGNKDDQGRRVCIACSEWHYEPSEYKPVATYWESTATGARFWLVFKEPNGKESHMCWELAGGESGLTQGSNEDPRPAK